MHTKALAHSNADITRNQGGNSNSKRSSGNQRDRRGCPIYANTRSVVAHVNIRTLSKGGDRKSEREKAVKYFRKQMLVETNCARHHRLHRLS